MKKRFLFLFLLAFVFLPKISLASSLSLSPATGSFTVGNTFNVSVLLDTQGKSINAMQVYLSFPADKLQVVSPSSGQSVVSVWTAPPKFDNTLGTFSLEGGIPHGIITSNGVLTTITFRVESTGEADVNFLNTSKLYLNDGLATPDLSSMQNAVYNFKPSAPEAPAVSSATEPYQNTWYSNSSAALYFSDKSIVDGYSYILDNKSGTIPDNVSEGAKNNVSYDNLTDGIHYFHIKALRAGLWGATTQFAIKIDTTPPADFPIEILPSNNTTSTKPVIQFTTTDATSGMDHYEIKLTDNFIESMSPYIPSDPLSGGNYDVVVRAFDKAGNYKEMSETLVINAPVANNTAPTTPPSAPLLNQGGDGGGNSAPVPAFSFTSFKFPTFSFPHFSLPSFSLPAFKLPSFSLPHLSLPAFSFPKISLSPFLNAINNLIVASGMWIWIVCVFLLIIFAFMAYKAYHFHREAHELYLEKQLPAPITQTLEELKAYQDKYGP